jgi:two-component system, sensor histidine kinase
MRITSKGSIGARTSYRKNTRMPTEKQIPIRIALADDEPAFLRTLELLLERLGHEVTCAVSNGAELVDSCLKSNVDLAIVDLDMPIMDGLAAAEHAAMIGVPVILLSGHADASEVVVEHEPIATRLCKPFAIEELQSAIISALHHRYQ